MNDCTQRQQQQPQHQQQPVCGRWMCRNCRVIYAIMFLIGIRASARLSRPLWKRAGGYVVQPSYRIVKGVCAHAGNGIGNGCEIAELSVCTSYTDVCN